MDTGTHTAMGIALGGLAYLQPEIAAQPTLAHAVMICTVLGSNAPDADGIFRLKGYASYVRNHRGLSHSWPALILWSLFISTLVSSLFSVQQWSTLLLWTSIAVFLHAIMDIYNTYGTQILRPISKKWVALNVIHIFDTFIFSVLILGIVLWAIGFHPGYTFLIAFIIIFFYYLWRMTAHSRMQSTIESEFPKVKVYVLPTSAWNTWHVIIETKASYYVRKRFKKHFELIDHFEKRSMQSPAYLAALQDSNVQGFLSFSTLYHWEEKKTAVGTEVKFFDLRFRTKDHYPFSAIVQLNEQNEIVDSYIGWNFKNFEAKAILG